MREDNQIVGKTMSAKIADRIRDEIITRKIAPGTRITAREIAEKYGVSSMPVREAFNILCGENLLEMNPYKGATVMAITPELVAQLNDLQYALESLLVELCMEGGYPKDILTQLEKINSEMAALEDDEQGLRNKRLGLNIKFHLLEYSPCKNHMAYKQFERNLYQISAIRGFYQVDLKRAKETLWEHQQIINSLRDNNIDEAIKYTKLHTKNSKLYALSDHFSK